MLPADMLAGQSENSTSTTRRKLDRRSAAQTRHLATQGLAISTRQEFSRPQVACYEQVSEEGTEPVLLCTGSDQVPPTSSDQAWLGARQSQQRRNVDRFRWTDWPWRTKRPLSAAHNDQEHPGTRLELCSPEWAVLLARNPCSDRRRRCRRGALLVGCAATGSADHHRLRLSSARNARRAARRRCATGPPAGVERIRDAGPLWVDTYTQYRGFNDCRACL